jgi:AraC-like DNA-binding protein
MGRSGSIAKSVTSDATRRLLAAAEELSTAQSATALESQQIEEFTQVYHDWLVFHRSAPSAPSDRHERSTLLLHCLMSASTLEETLGLLVRFNKFVSNNNLVNEIEDLGGAVMLRFLQPYNLSEHDLLNEINTLTFNLQRLEFLVGSTLDDVAGRVRSSSNLPKGIATLIFDRPLEYDMPELALIIPKRHLDRPVVARAAEAGTFLERFEHTAVSARRRKPSMKSLVAGLLRNGKLRDHAPVDLADIAARLGCSSATLWRRLRAEGTSFHEIRDAVFDDMAKTWLREGDVSIQSIAERLGYSDPYSFRRAFRRLNGHSPSAYRRAPGSGKVQAS